MKYAVASAVLAMCLIGLAVIQGGHWYVTLWPAISFIVLAAGYAKLGASVFGKRADGTIPLWAVVLLFPYLLVSWGLWHLLRMMQREDCCNEIVPGLWLGRRPLAHELPKEIDLIVDLTAEFFEPRGVIGQSTYLCLPVLDASVAECVPFEHIVEKISKWPGKVYIHCASGHGRSATLMAAVLIRKGFVGTLEQAIALIKKARPGIRLGKQQKQFLESWLQREKMGASRHD